MWLLVTPVYFLRCPIKTSEGTSVVASKPKIQTRSTENNKKKKKNPLFKLLRLRLNVMVAQSHPLISPGIPSPSRYSCEVTSPKPVGQDKPHLQSYFNILRRIMGASCVMAREQRNISHHTATATTNTLTTQYMVRFSHLTVQLPETRLFHTLDEQEGMIKKK